MKKFIIAILVLLSGTTVHLAQTKSLQKETDVCYKWQTQVDPSLERVLIDEKTFSAELHFENL